jgi:hypothetical protein
MKRVLIRAGKSPYVPFSGYETLERNVIGGNNGNLVFASAAHKLLAARGVEVKAHGYVFSAKHAPKINEEFDAVVLPLANAFRPSFESQLRSMTEFINNVDLPVIMLGGGAQSGEDGTFAHLRPMEQTIRAFVRAVLKRSSHITVRGEKTAQYLRSLGFNDILVIGCPSMTTNGRDHVVRPLRQHDSYKVAFNIETSKDLMGDLVSNIQRHHDADYFAQDRSTLEMMLWGVDKYPRTRDERLPLRSGHSQFQKNKAKYMLDARTWISALSDYDISVGPRAHGNIAAILAGTPAVIVAHDTRTQELAEYHEIPHFKPGEVYGIKKFEQVLERVDFKSFNLHHADRFDRVVKFLHENGLKTIYDDDEREALTKYEARFTSIDFPPPQRCAWSGMTSDEKERLRMARRKTVEDTKRIADLKNEIESLRETLRHASDIVGSV